MHTKIANLKGLAAICLALLVTMPTIAEAQVVIVPGQSSANQTETSTNTYVDSYGSHVETQTTTRLPGGIVQQQSSFSSIQNGSINQYKTICTQGICSTFAISCQTGQCEYRQIDNGFYYLFIGR